MQVCDLKQTVHCVLLIVLEGNCLGKISKSKSICSRFMASYTWPSWRIVSRETQSRYAWGT